MFENRYNSDDITFCMDECDRKICMRHPSNIMHKDIPHSFAHCKDTTYCPMKEEVRKMDETVGAWISVKDRLPDEDGDYLVYWNDTYIKSLRIMSFSANLEEVDEYDFKGENRPGWYKYDSEYGCVEYKGITHWMPLPEAPNCK